MVGAAADGTVAGAGRQFVQPLGTSWMSRYQVGESPAIVLEDGVALTCANTPPETIAEFGGGRYMLADGNVYLSAADNSDPRTNGRHYYLRWPTPLDSALVGLAALIARSADVRSRLGLSGSAAARCSRLRPWRSASRSSSCRSCCTARGR